MLDHAGNSLHRVRELAQIGIAVAVALTLSRFSLNPALMLLIGGVVRLGLRMVRL